MERSNRNLALKSSSGGGPELNLFTTVTRRDVILGSAASLAVLAISSKALALQLRSSHPSKPIGNHPVKKTEKFLTRDGTGIYYKDWGYGRPVVFSHGWPLSADAWDAQMLFLGQHGYRVIAHDRRGHGRSGQSRAGNDIDTYADDLAELMASLELKDAMLVGHSTGGGEVARYVGRHGTKQLSKIVLISAIPPLRLKTYRNSDGSPLSAFDELRATVFANRSQFLQDLSLPFFGYNRPGAKASQGVRDELWRMGMQASILATSEGIKAQSETDFTGDLKSFDVPTLILHGEDDQLVPVANSAMLTARIVKKATLKIYPGAPHGMTVTHADQVNRDLLTFLES